MQLDTAPVVRPRGQRRTDPVVARVSHLRELSAQDARLARDEAWAWIIESGERLRRDRRAALADLDALFHAGVPSRGISGPTEGALVGFTLQRHFDRAVAALATLWLPWAGKRFNARGNRGENLILKSARVPARLLWPRYRLREAGTALTGFDFLTRVDPSAVDDTHDVLVIDYAPVNANPALLIKRIRDELVEIVPGAHLGKMLLRTGSGSTARHHLLAYFALKSRL